MRKILLTKTAACGHIIEMYVVRDMDYSYRKRGRKERETMQLPSSALQDTATGFWLPKPKEGVHDQSRNQ